MKMMKAAVALGMALTMTVTGASAVFAEGETLSVATDFEIKTLVPWAASEENAFLVLNQAEEGLSRMDENNQPQPALCDTYEVSDDKLTYTFHLRDGIQWSNGEPVTAADFTDGTVSEFNSDDATEFDVQQETADNAEFASDTEDSISDKAGSNEADSDEEVFAEAVIPDENGAVDNRQLLEKYKPLVRQKTRKLFLIDGDKDDLIQEVMIGLFKAVRDYQVGKDAAFRTFADLCISRQLYSAIKKSNRLKNQPLNSYVSIYSDEFSDADELALSLIHI